MVRRPIAPSGFQSINFSYEWRPTKSFSLLYPPPPRFQSINFSYEWRQSMLSMMSIIHNFCFQSINFSYEWRPFHRRCLAGCFGVSNQLISPTSGDSNAQEDQTIRYNPGVSNQLISPTSGDYVIPDSARFVLCVSNQLISPTSGDSPLPAM